MEAYDPMLMYDAKGPSSTLQLFISCRNLKDMDFIGKSDPFCQVYIKNDNRSQWIRVGRTDTVVNSLNPDFAEPITIQYYFEKDQEIRFEVYDDDEGSADDQGKMTTKVGNLVGSKNQTFTADLLNKHGKGGQGSIIIKTDAVKGSNRVAKITAKCRNLKSKKKCF